MKILKSVNALFCSISITLFLLTNNMRAQDYEQNTKSKWTFFTSVQFSGGKYIYNDYSNIFLLYGGLKYQTGDWSIYGYLPVVAQNNSGFTQSGGMVIPSGMMGNQDGNNNNEMGGNMMGNSSNGSMMSNMSISLGDLYLYSTYQILKEYEHNIDLFINPGIKFPTASSSMGIGTGKFDYSISINSRKAIESFVLFADAGYIIFGDPDGVNYNNPFTYGIGLGKFLSNKVSVLLYYNAYTEVLEGYESPKQLLLGLNYQISDSNVLSISGSKGLSDYSPDFSFNLGLNFNLRNQFR